jgi:biotin carboxyl carrier protein
MTRLLVTLDGLAYEVELGAVSGDTCQVTVNGEALTVTVPHPETTVIDTEWLIVNGWPYEIGFDAALQWLKAYDGLHTVEIQDLNQRVTRPRSGDGRVKAPIPGLISRILVEPGATVSAGQPLLILEAMKMENEIRAPFEGVVVSVSAAVGQTVLRNQMLAEVQ